MSKKKYFKGYSIGNLTLFVHVLHKMGVVWVRDRVISKGFLQNWNLRTIESTISSNGFYHAIPIMKEINIDPIIRNDNIIYYKLLNSTQTFTFNKQYCTEGYCQCSLCGHMTSFTGTKLCDPCWNNTRGI